MYTAPGVFEYTDYIVRYEIVPEFGGDAVKIVESHTGVLTAHLDGIVWEDDTSRLTVLYEEMSGCITRDFVFMKGSEQRQRWLEEAYGGQDGWWAQYVTRFVDNYLQGTGLARIEENFRATLDSAYRMAWSHMGKNMVAITLLDGSPHFFFVDPAPEFVALMREQILY